MRYATICKDENFVTMTSSAGIVKGSRYYRLYCDKHRRPGKNSKAYMSIDVSKCSKCGYKGQCHRHRIKGFHSKYESVNIISLCTNCHSKAHNKNIS